LNKKETTAVFAKLTFHKMIKPSLCRFTAATGNAVCYQHPVKKMPTTFLPASILPQLNYSGKSFF